MKKSQTIQSKERNHKRIKGVLITSLVLGTILIPTSLTFADSSSVLADENKVQQDSSQVTPSAFTWELREDGYYYLAGSSGMNSRALDVNITFVDESTGSSVETQSYPKVHTSEGVFTDLNNQNYQVSINDPFVDYGSQDVNGHYRGVAIDGSSFVTDGNGNFNVTIKVQKLATGGTETPITPEQPTEPENPDTSTDSSDDNSQGNGSNTENTGSTSTDNSSDTQETSTSSSDTITTKPDESKTYALSGNNKTYDTSNTATEYKTKELPKTGDNSNKNITVIGLIASTISFGSILFRKIKLK